MKIKTKIIISIVALVIFTAASVLGIAFYQKGQLSTKIASEIDSLAQKNADSIARDVYLMCRAAQESVQLMVDAGLEVARDVLHSSGDVGLVDETVEWKAVNQYTKQSKTLQLPKMMVGSSWLGNNRQMSIKTPVVDKVKEMVGGTVTIFQRMNQDGDMLRVATNVEKLDGTRAVGTFIPKTNPDNKPNPVVSKVLKGETFRGRAFVVNAWYITAYEPIWDTAHNNVIGILYVGVKQENVESLRKGIMDITVGKTGHVTVYGGKGNQKGTYIISKNGQYDGKNALDARVNTGNPAIQNIINKGLALEAKVNSKNIPVAFERYEWKSSEHAQSQMKTAAISYFAPWDWVISAAYNEADFAASHNLIAAATASQINWIGGVALVAIIIAIIGGVLLANSISQPLKLTAEMVSEFQQGRLDKRLSLTRKDEIGEMAKAVDGFADNLQHEVVTAFEKLADGDFTFEATGAIRAPLANANVALSNLFHQVKIVGKQIASGASQISDASQSLSQGATESASSLEQISSSMNQMAAQTTQNAENANQANQLSSAAQLAAQNGNDHMQEMVTAMGEINEAGQNISKIIKTIDEIAFQTNLLALNAAVEAARAGQHGKGFAVVAEEVRNLAARSAKAAHETAELIEGSVEKTGRGAQIANRTSEALGDIVNGITRVTDLIVEITAASNEQAQGIAEINQGLTQIDAVTQQNTAHAEESAAVAQELDMQSGQMNNMLGRFILKDMSRSFEPTTVNTVSAHEQNSWASKVTPLDKSQKTGATSPQIEISLDG
ncbi:MAG: Cache 3/Cache 2 fusion domain-containing protein [Desulfuromonadales bacterium]|nr:Cache 3/Cache 2 fusion domain-containing protein [Desulfuromonadales bacterium]